MIEQQLEPQKLARRCSATIISSNSLFTVALRRRSVAGNGMPSLTYGSTM